MGPGISVVSSWPVPSLHPFISLLILPHPPHLPLPLSFAFWDTVSLYRPLRPRIHNFLSKYSKCWNYKHTTPHLCVHVYILRQKMVFHVSLFILISKFTQSVFWILFVFESPNFWLLFLGYSERGFSYYNILTYYETKPSSKVSAS